MPVRDRYHENLKNALIKDGWNVTNDPFHLKWGKKDLYVDLAAEKLLIAEKGTQKIAVEIKTFSGDSEVADLEQAIGQYFTYLAVMSRNYPDRVLYIAVHEDVFTDIFEEEPLGKLILEDYKIPLIVFNPKQEVIVRWVIWSNTGS
ncbi:element excision factor XisH family protein [Nostoc sp.]|uniref:element excision factor XisH family protein n=1 Tax=Nostoc sp. TaxID=1180 RepID=UPI002FF9620B